MTIATYSDLKTEIQSDLARADLGARVQRWVNQAERLIFHGGVFSGRRVSGLRVREMEKVEPALAVSGGNAAVPADYISPLELRDVAHFERSIAAAPSWRVLALENAASGSCSQVFTEIASFFHIRPKPADGELFWLRYIAEPAPLTETTQETNAIFPKYSDLYLEASLWKAFEYTRNYEAGSRKLETVISLLDGYNRERMDERQSESMASVMPFIVA